MGTLSISLKRSEDSNHWSLPSEATTYLLLIFWGRVLLIFMVIIDVCSLLSTFLATRSIWNKMPPVPLSPDCPPTSNNQRNRHLVSRLLWSIWVACSFSLFPAPCMQTQLNWMFEAVWMLRSLWTYERCSSLFFSKKS